MLFGSEPKRKALKITPFQLCSRELQNPKRERERERERGRDREHALEKEKENREEKRKGGRENVS